MTAYHVLERAILLEVKRVAGFKNVALGDLMEWSSHWFRAPFGERLLYVSSLRIWVSIKKPKGGFDGR